MWLAGSLLLLLVLAEPAVRRLPLSPAVLYLASGWAAGAVLGGPSLQTLLDRAAVLTVATELAVLASLFAVGLRLGAPARWRTWRAAFVLAGPGMVAMIAAGAVAAHVLMDVPWPLALLVAAVLAPTDPVLASEVQIRAATDRDEVRLTITAEGGMNDGSALPAVMAALAWLGLHDAGDGPGTVGRGWLVSDLLWPVGGGAVVGIALGHGLGRLLRRAAARGNPLRRDEWLYVAAVLLAFALARASGTSTFVVMFATAVALIGTRLDTRTGPAPAAVPATMPPLGDERPAVPLETLPLRLGHFGERVERLIEAGAVLAIGAALHAVTVTPAVLAFAAVTVLLVRPVTTGLSLLGPAAPGMTPRQRRLVAWFGIRGIGTLYYAAFALEHGVDGDAAAVLVAATLCTVALSILLHGVSATPLMLAYQRRRGGAGRRDAPAP